MDGKINYYYYSIFLTILTVVVALKNIEENTQLIMLTIIIIGFVINSWFYKIYKKIGEK